MNMNHYRTASLLCEFDASQRGEILSKVVQHIEQLPSMPKKVLAMYYYENLHPAEIAACLGLTEYEIELILAQTVGLLRTKLLRDLEQPESLNWTPLVRYFR
jgi:DNA-directed RNA polymerase specialized sigma subunit